jgi:hypothetical protein
MTLARIPVLLIALMISGCALPAPRGPSSDASPGADQLAQSAARGCTGLFGMRVGCVERSLTAAIEREGIGTVMGALDRLAERSRTMRDASHGMAHGLGIAAYRSPETVAELFASCPATQIGGCYHGVIQGYFLDVARRSGEVRAEDLNTLCTPHRGRLALYFQCTHGMGHGLMALHGNQLPEALKGCDLVEEPAARDSCYGGVFMENVMAAAHPHHTAQAHVALSAGEHAGHAEPAHQHGGTAAWKPLDARDPLYPCNAVGERYQYQCYLFQTSAVIALTGRPRAAARACAAAPQGMNAVCYRSLGRDLTSYASRDPGRTARLCARIAGAGATDCIRGAAESLVNVAADPGDGLALCRVVPGGPDKSACYLAVGRTMPALIPDQAERDRICAAVEAPHVRACRVGAFLDPADGG